MKKKKPTFSCVCLTVETFWWHEACPLDDLVILHGEHEIVLILVAEAVTSVHVQVRRLTEGLQWVLQSAVRRLTASVTSRVTSNMTVLWTNWCGFTLSWFTFMICCLGKFGYIVYSIYFRFLADIFFKAVQSSLYPLRYPYCCSHLLQVVTLPWIWYLYLGKCRTIY